MKEIPFKSVRMVFILLIFFILAILTAQAQQEVLNKDCSINWEVFNRDWKKYSDIDERLSFDELHWEGNRYYTTQKTLVDSKLQIYFLKRDMAIDAQMRLELRAYKDSLVKNIKVNLLKSFWRLAYSTYDTIKTATGLGGSYSKLFTAAGAIPKIGASLKVLKGLTPKKPRLAKNTEDTTKKIKAVSVSGALTAVESLADPIDTGMAVYNETVKQVFPTADFTEEEIKILRGQHLNNWMITQVLEESYRMNGERRKEVQSLEEKVQKLEQELIHWEAEEKKRVADMLVFNCKKRLKTAKKEEEPVEEEEVIYTELECPMAPSGFSIDKILMGLSEERSPEECPFGKLPVLSCFFLKKVTPELEHIVNLIYTGVVVWQFDSANEAEEEFEILINEGKRDTGKSNILHDSKDRFIAESIQWGNREDFQKNSYEYTDYWLVGFILNKNYVIEVYSNADVPISFEAKAITIAKAVFAELEEKTKLLLADRK